MPHEQEQLIINLNKNPSLLNESFIAQFGGLVKLLLRHMFGEGAGSPGRHKVEESSDGQPEPQVKIVGTPSQVETFMKTLRREKNYMKDYIEHGLGAPETFESRHALNRAVEEFENKTGILWPIK